MGAVFFFLDPVSDRRTRTERRGGERKGSPLLSPSLSRCLALGAEEMDGMGGRTSQC